MIHYLMIEYRGNNQSITAFQTVQSFPQYYWLLACNMLWRNQKSKVLFRDPTINMQRKTVPALICFRLEKNGGKRETPRSIVRYLTPHWNSLTKQKMNLVFLHSSPMPYLLHYSASPPNRGHCIWIPSVFSHRESLNAIPSHKSKIRFIE